MSLVSVLLIVLLVLLVIGALPVFPYSAGWSNYPAILLGGETLQQGVAARVQRGEPQHGHQPDDRHRHVQRAQPAHLHRVDELQRVILDQGLIANVAYVFRAHPASTTSEFSVATGQ